MTVLQPREWYSDVPRRTRTHTILGVSGLMFGFLSFGLWGGTAQIAGAVVTSGAFVASGQNRVVQHLEGGVIRDILVREGDLVTSGQTLILLDDTTPKAELRRLELRRAKLLVTIARLRSESEEYAEFSTPPELVGSTEDTEISQILATQRLTFAVRRRGLESDISALQDGINALQERIDGSTTQRDAVRRQLDLIDEELAGKETLLRSGYVRKPEVLALARARANLEGEVGRLTGEIGDARERISRAKEQIQNARNTLVKAAVEQLHDMSAELYDVRERIRAANRILERIAIAAPVRGVVVKMRYHTEGGVIEPGKNILEIVPIEEELVIEARVRPQDIDSVKHGQGCHGSADRPEPADDADGHRPGHLPVSADAVPDETRGRVQTTQPDVYVARVRLDAGQAVTVPGFIPAHRACRWRSISRRPSGRSSNI